MDQALIGWIDVELATGVKSSDAIDVGSPVALSIILALMHTLMKSSFSLARMTSTSRGSVGVDQATSTDCTDSSHTKHDTSSMGSGSVFSEPPLPAQTLPAVNDKCVDTVKEIIRILLATCRRSRSLPQHLTSPSSLLQLVCRR